MKEELFSIDIGTRKVLGIVAVSRDGCLEIIDAELAEHSSRPMLDGQIHNIEEAARTVMGVKSRLEARLKRKLRSAGVAVAGRNLITRASRIEKTFDSVRELTPALLKDIELEAVDGIVSASATDLSRFYCVGYSPVYYELDSQRIREPAGHRARTVATQVLATFLPRIVLDSILSVLNSCGLAPTTITLEPICAAAAIVPSDMRTMNILLVDIGAGTSDLAVTRDSSVFAYGMVPMAGDEITECLAESLLTDFATAEGVKRAVGSGEYVEYRDLWNRQHRIRTASVQEKIQPAVSALAKAIAAASTELNGGNPRAVVLVGGGSRTPGIADAVSSAMGISSEQVGIRLPQMIQNIKDATGSLTGPEAVTPIGIALMTQKAQGLRFIQVQVNGAPVAMLDFEQKKDVLGALTLSGALSGATLYPRPGMAMTVTLNGELIAIKGTLGEAARIFLNGEPVSSLTDRIKDGDRLQFEGAVDGTDASARVGDLIRAGSVSLTFNGEQRTVKRRIIKNGAEVSSDEPICDRDVIVTPVLTCRDLLVFEGIDPQALTQYRIGVTINGEARTVIRRNFRLSANAQECDLDTVLNNGSTVEFRRQIPSRVTVGSLVDMPDSSEKIRISVDGREIEVTLDTVQVFMNGKQVDAEEPVADGASLAVYRVKERKVLLSEIFKYIDVDPTQVLGKRLRITVDDSPAGFTTPLSEGARVSVRFEDRNN